MCGDPRPSWSYLCGKCRALRDAARAASNREQRRVVEAPDGSRVLWHSPKEKQTQYPPPAESRVMRDGYKRLRRAPTSTKAAGEVCGCGRDFLVVPLEEAHRCPSPR